METAHRFVDESINGRHSSVPADFRELRFCRMKIARSCPGETFL